MRSARYIACILIASALVSSCATSSSTSGSQDTVHFSIAPGTYAADQQLSLVGSGKDVSVYYTLDGSDPSSSSTLFTQPIALRGPSSSTLVKAVAQRKGGKPGQIAEGTFRIQYPQTPEPRLGIAPGTYPAGQIISLACADPNAVIHFTVDGSEPKVSSPVFQDPITLNNDGDTLSLRALSLAPGKVASKEVKADYRIDFPSAATPLLSRGTGTYTSDFELEVTAAEGLELRYTTDGSDPLPSSLLYDKPIVVAGDGVALSLRIKAFGQGLKPSTEVKADFRIRYDRLTAPTFSAQAGVKDKDFELAISAQDGAQVYYTLDGSDPAVSATVYSAPIPIAGNNSSTRVRAIARQKGMADSAAVDAVFEVRYPDAPKPRLSVAPGTYTKQITVQLLSDIPGATIYFTTNGSAPTTAARVYKTPILLTGSGASLRVRAILVADGFSPSEIVQGYYQLDYETTAPPSFSLLTGTYSRDQKISLFCETQGAQIRFTTDGSDPGLQSELYGLPIPVEGDGSDVVIKAIAIKQGFKQSIATQAEYKVDYGTTSSPQFSRAGGTYNRDISVAITCESPGAVIYYTIDGSAPDTKSPRYTVPILVGGSGSSIRIQAVALAPGLNPSTISGADYVIIR